MKSTATCAAMQRCGRATRNLARAALAALMFLCACSNQSSAPKKAVIPTPVDPATAGKIQVEVAYTGTVPTPRAIDMRSAAQCAAAHTEPVYDQSLMVEGGGLANAVVWIKDGLQHWVFAPPEDVVVVDQKGCVYAPHVAAAMVGQAVEFRNSDREAHNVHGRPQLLSGWNFLLSHPGASQRLSFDKPEVAVPVGCDIHPWMRAYVAVFKHPFFVVTDKDGRFEIKGVPAGEQKLVIWHTVGFVNPGLGRGMPVTVKAGEAVDVGEIKLDPARVKG